MNRIIVAVLLCLSYSMTFAQSDKEKRKTIKDQQELIKRYETECKELANQLKTIDSLIDIIKDRTFAPETPEERIKKRLICFDNIQSLANDEKFQREWSVGSQLTNPYELVIKMYKTTESITETGINRSKGYNKEENDKFVALLDDLRKKLLDLNHKDSFMKSYDQLATQIQDYRFVMYELLRVFDLVDEMENEGKEQAKIRYDLKAENETEDIDKIPFAKGLLEAYIKGNAEMRGKIRGRSYFETIN